ncbi:conserved hypothetical protein [Gammaproteobacteria bacterium]
MGSFTLEPIKRISMRNKNTNYIKTINIVIVFFVIGFVGRAAAGPLEYGVNAFQQGDYAGAFRVWSPLADQGNAIAQYNLGVMYYEGQGVPRDYGSAVKWFLRAANQGNSDAQRSLGVLYYEGNGVPQDDVRAYMWFDLSAINGNQEGLDNRNMIAKRMTFAQISEAQRLTRGWRPTHDRRGR